MTKKPKGHVFLKTPLPAETLQALDTALELHGLLRARAWVIREIVDMFIAETARMDAAGELGAFTHADEPA